MSIKHSDQYEVGREIVRTATNEDILADIKQELENVREQKYRSSEPEIFALNKLYSEMETLIDNSDDLNEFLDGVEQKRQDYSEGIRIMGFEVGKSELFASERSCFDSLVFEICAGAVENYESSAEEEAYTYL
ncbi:MAG: hypothetical protein H8Z69_05960 [Nanohaloarchaea archaeon]|nr:hypothetical protein [Candidatus Nanohaloarchaea archaeon]